MREILFRGKNLGSGEWVYGVLDNYKQRRLQIIVNNGTIYGVRMVVDPDTVGQFTGEYDDLQNRIYEGDIVELCGVPEAGQRIVVFSDGAFCIAKREEYECLKRGEHPFLNDYAHLDCLNTWSDPGPVRIVGNVYDV